jgi:hypothetical protein
VEYAIGEPLNAVTGTCAPTAAESIHERNVRRKIETSEQYMRPKFARDLVWGQIDDDISPAARYSLFAEPLPRPPQSELQNVIANETISAHPQLCKITCNINTKKFNHLLRDHPNQPFVQSVLLGLTEGFWPWAEPQDGYPVTHNEPQHPPRTDRERDFLLTQRKKEIDAKRFLRPFRRSSAWHECHSSSCCSKTS